jgi:hypothetical protein
MVASQTLHRTHSQGNTGPREQLKSNRQTQNLSHTLPHMPCAMPSPAARHKGGTGYYISTQNAYSRAPTKQRPMPLTYPNQVPGPNLRYTRFPS